ncbi:MraZ family transcriptional regulator [Atopobiaceae bacterium 24-176]
MYLTGSRKHSLDSKARLTLPADMRREFKEKVCLVPLNDALYGFTPEGHRAWVDGFFPNGFDQRSKEDVRLRLVLNSKTVTVDIDSAGRIALGKVPEQDRSKLGLAGEVMVVGNDDHFEVWNVEEWEKAQQAFDDDLETLMFGGM